MLPLVDYKYFCENYDNHSMPYPLFTNYSLKASNKINHFTFNRITEEMIDNNVRNTACELIILLAEHEKSIAELNNNKLIKTSETVGPHSINYANKTNLQFQRILNNQELDNECYKICYEHLAHTGLMYRGIN